RLSFFFRISVVQRPSAVQPVTTLLRPCYDLVTTSTSKTYNVHAVCYDVTTCTPGEPPPLPRRRQTKAGRSNPNLNLDLNRKPNRNSPRRNNHDNRNSDCHSCEPAIPVFAQIRVIRG